MRVTAAEYGLILQQFNKLAKVTTNGLSLTVFNEWFEEKYNIGPWEKARIEVTA